MSETLIASGDPKDPFGSAPAGSVSLVESLFHRRIEFHPARKPYSYALIAGDFHLDTLNPGQGLNRQAAGAGAPVRAPEKRLEGSELKEHGLDPELSFRITFRRIGAGLANLGNTCFLNSVLQCLTYTEPFAAYLQSGKHKSFCHTAGFCAMCALQSHVMNALQSSGKILSPSHLVKNLRCISRNFRNSRQEDAHEYMINLLESVHKCCLPSGVPSESPSAYERSLVHKIFGGHLRSQVKCMQCSCCSNKFDPFLDLSLEITKANSLHKALKHFTAMEQLDGGEKQYQCHRCKQKVKALKQLTIHKAPYVLTIHLKRFGSNIPGQKIDKMVEFGPTLNLKPFMSDSQEDVTYTLYGVLIHAGWSTHSGHYYCFIRTSSGMWHSLDDNQISQVSEKAVLSQKAYMLFYARDRNTSIKQSVNVMSNESKTENAVGPKAVSHAVPRLYEAIQNSVKGGNNISRDVSVLQRDGLAKLKDVSVMQNDTVDIARELQKTTVPVDSAKDVGDANMSSQNINMPEEMDLDNMHSRSGRVVENQNKDALNGLLGRNNDWNLFGQTKSCEASGKDRSHGDCSKSDLKPRKVAKLPPVRGIFFGHKQLFFSSFSMAHSKRSKKSKRRHSNSILREKVVENIGMVEHGTSTSEVHGNVPDISILSSRKRPHSSLDMEKYTHEVNDVKCCNGGSLNTKDSVMEERRDKNVEFATIGQPKIFVSSATEHHDARETDGRIGSSGLGNFLSILTRGLKETTVPQWDEMDSPSIQINGSQDAGNSSIGFVLDEWDENYDRGKMKKVKKSKLSFGRRNPFQEAANTKAQLKMKANVFPTSVVNEPFRI